MSRVEIIVRTIQSLLTETIESSSKVVFAIMPHYSTIALKIPNKIYYYRI